VPSELAATTLELLAHLERHLIDEEAVLAANGGGEDAWWSPAGRQPSRALSSLLQSEPGGEGAGRPDAIPREPTS
jgi:hypothetical protein